MSTIKTKNVQVGTDGTASNNFTIYVPGTPDGTVRIGNGDAGAVTDAVTINSSGAVTLANNLTVTGTGSINGSNISTQPSFRNLIINGDMRIAQRGTSFTGVASSGYYTLDRFQVSVTPSTSVWTVTQSTDVPTGQGFATSLKCDCTTAFTSYTGGQSATITHIVEAQNLQHLKVGTSSAESLTLSFWIKSNTTGNYVAWLYTPDGTARFTNKVFTINTADTWEKKTITVSGDTAGTINNDNGHGMYMRVILASGSGYTSGTSPDGTWEDASTTTNWYAGQTVNLSSSTSNYINITGVQLEVGSGASDFEFLPVDVELARCQRYCEVYSGNDVLLPAVGGWQGTTLANVTMSYKVIKRAAPTITFNGTTSNYQAVNEGVAWRAASAIASFRAYENTCELQITTSSGGTQGQSARFRLLGDAVIIISAEL